MDGGQKDPSPEQGEQGEGEDAETPDSEPPTRSPSSDACAFFPEDGAIVAETFVSPEDPLALSVRNEGAMLSWVAYTNAKRKVTPMWFSHGSSDVAGGPIADVDSVQREPSSVATGEGFMAVWSDDRTGSFDLFARVIGATGSQGEGQTAVRLTTDEDDDRSPVLATGANDNVLVAFRAEKALDQGRTLLLDQDGEPLESARDIPGFGATLGRPALSSLGTGYVLAWVDAASRQVRLQRLNEVGAPSGPYVRADMDGSAAGHLDLTTHEEGGALTFDVLIGGKRAEVRFRAFDAAGMLLGSEQSLTPYPERALSPSIAAFRGGYAVAYRSASDEHASSVLRVALVDSHGEHVSSLEIASLRDLNLPTVLRVSPDARRIFVAFTDRVEDSGAYELRRAWLRCD